MSAIKATEIAGDVTVGRHVTTGGNATIQGDADVRLNLRVAGWLEARNIKGALKGFFPTVEALRAAYPLPETGWLALVGESMPATIWYGEGEEWKTKGATCGQISADASALLASLREQANNTKESLDFLYRTLDKDFVRGIEVVETAEGVKLVLKLYDPVDDGSTAEEVAVLLAGAAQVDKNTTRIQKLTTDKANVPVEVESEEAMAAMIAAGEVIPGQIYFIAEEE